MKLLQVEKPKGKLEKGTTLKTDKFTTTSYYKNDQLYEKCKWKGKEEFIWYKLVDEEDLV
jgi:hypothetical protein